MAGLFCLFLMGFAAASYATVRFDVLSSPTEVINTGRSEVTGSVTLVVRGTGNVTGSGAGGSTQIAFLYTNPAMAIDNPQGTGGIRLFYSSGFVPAFGNVEPSIASPGITDVHNATINNECSGTITINMANGIAVTEGDFIRLEGVRGRIDISKAFTPNTDLFVSLQSVNDPAAQIFDKDEVRVAKSFDGMNVEITSDTLLLCFPTLGKAPGDEITYQIKITEGFSRAFVDNIPVANPRVDDFGEGSGSPTNATQFLIWFETIPLSVSGIIYDVSVADEGTGAELILVGDPTFTPSAGVSTAIYRFHAVDQTGVSDSHEPETFVLTPDIILKSGSTEVGDVKAAVSLYPTASATAACTNPSSAARPRFLLKYESDSVANEHLTGANGDGHKVYASIIRCNCYLLFTYVTATTDFNTGIAVANTTGDTSPTGDNGPFGINGAPDQLGKITFYFYEAATSYVGSYTTPADYAAGQSYIGLVSGMLAGLTPARTEFSGYIIAKADFQFCHGFAYIADSSFGNTAHGYIANVIPDPAIRGNLDSSLVRHRTAAAAGDHTNIPAGEGLNN